MSAYTSSSFSRLLDTTAPKMWSVGDVVPGTVPLAPLHGVGCYHLGGQQNQEWPTWGSTCPSFANETIQLFSTRENFAGRVFGGQWPDRMAPGRPTASTYAPHLRDLANSGVIRGPVDRDVARLFGTYFAVAKDVENFVPREARAIFDLRTANEINVPDPPMPMFSVRELLRAWSHLGSQVTFVETDLRNYYYQLRIPQWMEELMAVQLADTKEIFVSRVLPMGWDRSCKVAQALTVAGVGMHRVGEDTLGIHQEVRELTTPPSLLELRWQGFRGSLAVIYDTVFLALENGRWATLWKERLALNFEGRLRMHLKYLRTSRAATFDGLDVRQGRDGLQWRIAAATLEIWKKVVPHLRPTPRALWKTLGFLRRASDVQLWPRHALAGATRAQAVIASENSTSLTSASWWDSEIIAVALITDLAAQVTALQNPWMSAASLRASRKRKRQKVLLVAVDATLKLLSIAIFAEGGNLESWPEARGTIGAGSIDEYETEALAWGTVAAHDADILVIGGDNTAASRAVWKGFSLSPGIEKHMHQPRQGQVRLIVDIPTKVNFADVKTRPDVQCSPEELVARREGTVALLSAALDAWRKWPGDTYFARDHSTASEAGSASDVA